MYSLGIVFPYIGGLLLLFKGKYVNEKRKGSSVVSASLSYGLFKNPKWFSDWNEHFSEMIV